MPRHFPEPLTRLLVDCWHPDAGTRPIFTEVLKRLESIEEAPREIGACRVETVGAPAEHARHTVSQEDVTEGEGVGVGT